MPNHKSNREGVQLGLDPGDPGLEDWLLEQELLRECEVYAGRLVTDLGLPPGGAKRQAAHMRAMVHFVHAGTIAKFFDDPEQIVSAIGRGAAGLPEQRHLVVIDYLQVCADQLGAGVREDCEAAFEELFPSRPTTPKPGLVNRIVAGSTKRSTRSGQISWFDGERLIDVAAGAPDPMESARAAALMALHVRSGMPTPVIALLTWEQVASLYGPVHDEDYYVVPIERRGKIRPYGLHVLAVERLRELSRRLGAPDSGPVFVASRRPYRPLGPCGIAKIIRSVVRAAGYRRTLRTHMRRAFAHVLADVRHWPDVRVRDALGFDELRQLDELLERPRDRSAQVLSTELLVIPEDVCETEERTASADAEVAGLSYSAPGRLV